jgi:lichenan operon transcriptional antiterminator
MCYRTIDALTIQRKNLESYDLIVSTVPLKVKTTKPIIYISSLLDDKDVQSIRLRFSEDRLSIAEFFDHRLFFKDLEAKTKEEIILFMSNKISELYNLKEGFYDSVLVRESMASTEFGNLIAIPHPDKSFTPHTIVSVALLKEPIIWNEREVQLVFMLSYGDSETDNLDTFFAKSAHFLTDAKEIEKAIKVKNYDEFIHIIDWN